MVLPQLPTHNASDQIDRSVASEGRALGTPNFEAQERGNGNHIIDLTIDASEAHVADFSKRPPNLPDCEVISLNESSDEDIKPKVRTEAIETKLEGLTTDYLNRTWLRVTASNRTDRAPCDVPLAYCQTLGDLFKILTRECELPGKKSSKVAKISAQCWDGKKFLFCKDNATGWTRFIGKIRDAWKRSKSVGCEVDILLHVEE